MSSPVVVTLLPHLIRIRSKGNDRVKFLHNFCTNDINSMETGTACEAFFTSVKARILGHGYVLAGAEHHEIWMLPGNEDSLLEHLNRYIISEDVTFESMTGGLAAMAVTGKIPVSLVRGEGNEPGTWTDTHVENVAVTCLRLNWAGQSLTLLSGPRQAIETLQTRIVEHGRMGRWTEFERLRILERFPLIGSDLTDDHLAPEAARNTSAICYTKGCYLGQEPIARIDAMGQVNRVLATVELQTEELQAESLESETACQLTSVDNEHSTTVGLAIVKADDIRSGSTLVRSSDNSFFSATISQPKSLTGD
jgi:folate-binding protein YgfZ